nr:hypothetical protein [Alphaproteobacteria bacterium]
PPAQTVGGGRLAFGYFLLCALGYIIYLFCVQTAWLTGGEMWAEAATRYYPAAMQPSLWTRLFAPEAGYLPVIGRLIALAVHEVGLPARWIGHVYNLSAVILTAFTLAAFCLPRFRPIVPSNTARFVFAAACLLLLDWQTVTFINFTHVGIIICAGFSMLALLSVHDEIDDAPRWAWVMTLFLVSKPYYITLLPIFLLGIFVAKPRYRALMATWSVAVLAQATQLFISMLGGTLAAARAVDITAAEKIASAVLHFLGFMGSMPLGPGAATGMYAAHSGPDHQIFYGMAFCMAAALITFYHKRVRLLMLCGFLMLGITLLINVFALTAEWNFSFGFLKYLFIYRHAMAAYFGFLFLGLGTAIFIADISTRGMVRIRGPVWPRVTALLPAILFALWFYQSGWLRAGYGGIVWPDFIYRGGSAWQQMSDELDQGMTGNYCVPVNPFPWRMGHHCTIYNEAQLPKPDAPLYVLSASDLKNGIWIDVPDAYRQKPILGIGLLASRRADTGAKKISAKVTLYGADKEQRTWQGYVVMESRGLIFMNGAGTAREFTGARKIHIEIEQPVDLVAEQKNGKLRPAIVWYGVDPDPSHNEKF